MIIAVWICVLLAMGMMKILDDSDDKQSAKTMIWIGIFCVSFVASLMVEGLGTIVFLVLCIAFLIVSAHSKK